MRHGSGFRITERDDEMVRFAGLHMAVEARQLAAWLEMDVDHVWRRAARLTEIGLLEHRRIVHGRPGVYLATAAGLDRAGLALPPARINFAHYAHSLELVWLFIELEREFGISRVRAERELRSIELQELALAQSERKRHRPRYGAPMRRAARGLHFPDLVVEWGAPEGGLLAIELELSVKSRSRRAQIIAAYGAAANIERVRYYATAEPLRALERSLAAEGADGHDSIFDLYRWAVEAEATA